MSRVSPGSEETPRSGIGYALTAFKGIFRIFGIFGLVKLGNEELRGPHGW